MSRILYYRLAKLDKHVPSTLRLGYWLCSLSVALCTACGPTTKPSETTSTPGTSSTSEKTAHSGSATMTTQPFTPISIRRNQPRIHSLRIWGDSFLVDMAPFAVLDLQKEITSPLKITGCQRIIDVAHYPGGAPFVLCKNDNTFGIIERSSGGWQNISMPENTATSTGDLRITAFENTLALLETQGKEKIQTVHVRKGGAWVSTIMNPQKSTPWNMGYPTHVLLEASRLWIGYSRGEWGGGALFCDLGARDWQPLSNLFQGEMGQLPVVGIKLDSSKNLWIGSGVSHMGLAEGSLIARTGATFETIVSTNRRAQSGKTTQNLPKGSIDALAFDQKGRTYIAGGSFGVARLDGDRWTLLTSRWPKDNFVYLQDLAIAPDGRLIIGTFDAGVLLWDADSQNVTTITLPSPQ